MVRIKYPLKEFGKLYKGKKIYWFTSNYFWLCDYDNADALDIPINPVTVYSLDPDDDYLADSDTYPDYFAKEEKVELYSERSTTLAGMGIRTSDVICLDELIVNLELKEKIFLEAVTIR